MLKKFILMGMHDQKSLETIALEDPAMQLLLPCQGHLMKMLVRCKLSFISLLNSQLYKWVKISLGCRSVSSCLLLSSMNSQNNPTITQLFSVFRKQLTGFSLISSLHCAYCQHLMKEPICLMWPVKQHVVCVNQDRQLQVFANGNG